MDNDAMNDDFVKYSPDYLYKTEMIDVNGVNISVRVPIAATWILLENDRLLVSKSNSPPEKSDGFVNVHNGEYEDYPHYKGNYNQFIGHLCMNHRGLKHWRCKQ